MNQSAKRSAALVVVFLCITTVAPAALAQVEVSTRDFMQDKLRKELGDQLQPSATIKFSRATFTLNAPDGTTRVNGTVSMLERVNEVRAVQTLEAMKKSDVYKDALKKSASAPVAFGKSLVDEPVDTLKDAAVGLGGFLADVGYSVVSDDPSQENVAKTALGHAASKRQFAFQLGVNPYSHYQPLQDALSEVSWTAVGGGLTVTGAFRAVKGAPGSVLTTTKTANMGRTLVRDLSPRELGNRNLEALLEIGVQEELADALLDNHSFDPEAETRLVTALQSMAGVAGREAIVSRASLAASRNRAEVMRDWVELMAAYHELVEPVDRVVLLSTAPFLIDKKNRAHGVFPTDYVMNASPGSSDLAAVSGAAKQAGYGLGSIYATGKIDAAAKQQLKELGWTRVQDFAENILREEAKP